MAARSGDWLHHLSPEELAEIDLYAMDAGIDLWTRSREG